MSGAFIDEKSGVLKVSHCRTCRTEKTILYRKLKMHVFNFNFSYIEAV
nr:MAG TPA: hypothetical protein [Caudoviricetes sp.]